MAAMYRVALHPQNQSFSTSTPTVQLPRTLKRPTPCDPPARAILDVIAPELAELPLPFIRHQFSLRAGEMLAGIQDLVIPGTISRLCLPSTLTVPVPSNPSNDAPLYPTHVLAVSPRGAHPDAPLILVPVHGIVLAANCAAPILRPGPVDSDSVRDKLILPICPAALPSVHALVVLRTYMYTHRLDTLIHALIPLPEPLAHAAVKTALGSAEEILRLATHLVCVRPGLEHLLAYAARVRELWQTVCCLGMFHAPLWDALDLAWELVIVALNLA
ncbi:hypothetical protein C8R44DRAFT_665548, partial [Mycena epipterygia]